MMGFEVTMCVLNKDLLSAREKVSSEDHLRAEEG